MEKSKVEISNGIICAEISGTFNLSDSKVIFQDVLEQARNQGLNKIIFDVRNLEGNVTTLDRFEFGKFMADLRIFSTKIAFVGTPMNVWSPPFLENVAVNRGANIKVTTDKNTAVKWLNA